MYGGDRYIFYLFASILFIISGALAIAAPIIVGIFFNIPTFPGVYIMHKIIRQMILGFGTFGTGTALLYLDVNPYLLILTDTVVGSGCSLQRAPSP